jgi:hypothetical protein
MGRFGSTVAMLCFCLSTIFGTSSASTTQPSGQPHITEFEIGDSNHPILIPVVWHGKTGYFLLDTGTFTSVLDTSAFPDLVDLHKASDMQTPAGLQNLEFYTPPDLEVGPVNLRDTSYVGKADLSILSEYCGRTIMGILGVTGLKNFVVQIDFDARRLRFMPPDYDAHPEWGRAQGMFPVEGIPAIVIKETNGDTAVKLDTGSMCGMTLPSEGFEQARAAAHTSALLNSITSFGGEEQSQCLRWPSLPLEGWSYRDVIIEETNDQTPSLGLPFLSRNLVTFDFPNLIFYLKPGKEFNRPDEFRTSELCALRIGANTVVKGVDSDSSLYKAGIRDDDVLMNVNGKSAGDWDVIDLGVLLRSENAGKLSVTFRRRDHTQTVSLEARPDEPATQPSADATTKECLDWLQALVTNCHLELSTAPASATNQFCFEWSIAWDANAQQISLPPCRGLVARNKDRDAILLRTMSCDCYSYLTNGLLLTVDHDHPGHLTRIRVGYPKFIYQMQENGSFQFYCGFDTGVDSPQIVLALNDVIASIISKAKTACYDDPTKTFTVQTLRSISHIEIVPGNMAYPVKTLLSHSADGPILKYTILGYSAVPDAYAKLLTDPAKIEKELASMDVKFEDIPFADVTPEVFKKAIAVPTDLGKDPREQALLSKLKTLLIPDAAANRPD